LGDVLVGDVGWLCPEDLGVLHEDEGARYACTADASFIATDGNGELGGGDGFGSLVGGDADDCEEGVRRGQDRGGRMTYCPGPLPGRGRGSQSGGSTLRALGSRRRWQG
jgi:hypothetical protein